MIFKSPFADIEIPVKGVYQYVTTNPNGIRDDKVLFIDGMTDKRLTYGAVKSRARRFAAGLIDRAGFQRGDVLAIFSPNQIEFSVVTLGTIIAGGTATFANPLYTVEELAYQLKDAGARYLVAFPSCLTTAIEAAAVAKIPKSNVFSFGDQGINEVRSYRSLLSEREAIPIEYSPEEARSTTAYICYSSGTSGRSKGVELTHANFVANMAQIHHHMDDILPDTSLVGVLPFYHVYGLMLLNHLMILKGSSIVTMPSFDLTNFCRIIQEYKINTLPVVPPIVLLLIKDPTSRRYDLSSLRLCISGAAPLSKELAQEFVRTFKIPIKQGYGLTETSTVSHLTKTNRIVVGSIGRPLPNVECKLLSEEGRELGYNQPGELCLRGPNIMKGYLNNREATDACIDGEGWFHTGDIAMVDDSGFFYIVGRVKELIKYKGLQISPVELESILITHPSIADAAVIGVYSEQDATEYPVAYVVLRPNAPPSDQLKEEIKGFLAQRVTPHKKLRGGVLFIDQIPKSAAGKILRRILIERVKNEHPIYTKGSYQNPLLSQSKL